MAATTLVIQECQNGVIGPDSLLPRLAEAAAPAVPFIARLAHGARAAGVPVIHALATTRADGYGEPGNAPLYRMAARAGKPLLAGTPAADVIAEIGRDERDLVVPRAGWGRCMTPAWSRCCAGSASAPWWPPACR